MAAHTDYLEETTPITITITITVNHYQLGKTYCPGGYEFGSKPNLITWIAEIFFVCSIGMSLPANSQRERG
jgi:hypothetical protein